ncbi:hypothetical protein A2957_02550 [Candidatus Roizmanbacteria bacterium RIFCSPLOWO2_01_FULL_38_11]|uniref:4a-hydroxytetrahydrobiopterin dehydratase n=1 Tax=Candidatus Roizmanbacteria bacterium RIFCSPLOWO2_01_FULL_38_11 TaxID=1802060 RepID=A0A1F7INH6_9BACT|nr:MAG: hypothetical protein A2957_02550 [Candidatus Roizmanbacteria bacterium RIFCSPLOWO2_01_FULL_38_11]
MNDLFLQKCIPCKGTDRPMTPQEFTVHLSSVPDWEVFQNKEIKKLFTFKNFKEALAFVNKVGAIAEEQGHHPNIFLHNWNKVTITLTTFAIKGLSLNDFIMAAKIDKHFS